MSRQSPRHITYGIEDFPLKPSDVCSVDGWYSFSIENRSMVLDGSVLVNWQTICYIWICINWTQLNFLQMRSALRPRLSKRGSLIKHDSRFCFCIACFSPKMFSLTHVMKYMLSCEMRLFMTRLLCGKQSRQNQAPPNSQYVTHLVITISGLQFPSASSWILDGHKQVILVATTHKVHSMLLPYVTPILQAAVGDK